MFRLKGKTINKELTIPKTIAAVSYVCKRPLQLVDEWKTNLMSLAISFHLLCAQYVSDINISIFRSLRLCWWITTSVVLFSFRCVLELLVRAVFGGVRFAGKLLKMDILMSETFWAHNKWNKIASDIKFVFRSSTVKMIQKLYFPLDNDGHMSFNVKMKVI